VTARGRVPSLLAVATGALSVVAVLYASRGATSVILKGLFVLWVTAPFAVLMLLYRANSGRAVATQTRIHRFGYVLCAASTGVYAFVAFGLSRSKPAFWFLMMPLLCLVLIAIAFATARRSDRSRATAGSS